MQEHQGLGSPFQHLEPDIIASLQELMHISSLEPGEVIFSQGSQASDVFIVVTGRIKVIRTSLDGHAIILCMPGPGDFFCPLPVIDHGPHLGLAQAITHVTLQKIESEDFLALCEKYPKLLSAVQGSCLGEVRRLAQRLESITFDSLKNRLALTLTNENLRLKVINGKETEIKLTQEELAQMVGASRESVSRILQVWESEGILTLKRGGLTVCSQDKLNQLIRA
jgi:CRP/FNR family transcriptional regulator, cyclic AMP receptor protein